MQLIRKYAIYLNILLLLSLFWGGWKKTSEISDFRDYYRASKLWSEKKDIYQFEEIKELQKDFKLEDLYKAQVLEKLQSMQGNIASYIYPPPFAVMLLPISTLEYTVASRIFYILNFCCLLGTIYLLYRMNFSMQFGFVLLGTILFSYRFLENHGNNNQVAFILLFFSIWSVKSQKDAWSGFLLATAIVIKLTPAILFLYFLYERRWKVILYSGIFLLGWFAFPCLQDMDYGLKQWSNWNEMVFQSAMKSPLFRAWKNNQSLIATLSKYFLMGADPVNQMILKMPFVTLEPSTVKLWFILLAGFISIPLFVKMRKGLGDKQLFSVLLVLSCIFSGISWIHSFVFLFVPIFYILLNIPTYREKKSEFIKQITPLLLIVLSSRILIGKGLEDILLMLSILLYVSIAIYWNILQVEEE